MIPTIGIMVAAYIGFRMIEVFLFPKGRYSGGVAHTIATVLAFLVLIVAAISAWELLMTSLPKLP